MITKNMLNIYLICSSSNTSKRCTTPLNTTQTVISLAVSSLSRYRSTIPPLGIIFPKHYQHTNGDRQTTLKKSKRYLLLAIRHTYRNQKVIHSQQHYSKIFQDQKDLLHLVLLSSQVQPISRPFHFPTYKNYTSKICKRHQVYSPPRFHLISLSKT